MAPLLFNILFSLMLHVAFKGCDKGVYIRFCTDSGIFNLRQMSAKTKGKELLSWELYSCRRLHIFPIRGATCNLDRFSDAACKLGLVISLKKTELWYKLDLVTL